MADQAGPSDSDLVRAVGAGDPGAFELLYRRHAPVVRRTVAGMLREADRVDDAVQDVFLKALERLSTLREADKVAAWLKAIARNVAADRLRGRVESDIDDLVGDAVAEPSAGVDELAEIRELSHLVRGALTQLAPRDVQAVAMAGFLDASPAEIAEALGVSPGAAKVVLHRARRRLRLALKLELLVRRRGVACAEFRGLADAGELVAAARHLTGCEACQRAGSAEIRLYEVPRGPTSSAASAIVRGPAGERTVTIEGRLVIGRDLGDVPAAERLVIDDPGVSRQHVEIRVDRAAGRAYAIDSSTNGTRLNGVRLERATPIVLATGDVLTVAGFEIELDLGEPSPASDGGARTTMRRAVNAPMVMVVGDIVGYTGIAERIGSGPLGALLDRLFGELRLLLRAFGGTVGNIAGDAFFAVWELDHDEEGGQRALDFALVAQRVAGRFADPEAAPIPNVGLRLGWAVSVGEGALSVVAGSVTTVVGDATNVAFRLASLAGRDGRPGILVTAPLAATLGDRFLFGDEELVMVKGRAEPVAVTALVERTPG